MQLLIYIIIKNNSKYIPAKLQTLIVSENSFIDHNNKNDPINKNYLYQFTTNYNSLEFSKINFNFQYVKYESDDGLFFKNNKLFNGISFSDITDYRNIDEGYNLKENFLKNNSSTIGVIKFTINKSYYDYYKRSYPRFQSLLADVMSVVSLLFEIGRQISYFLIIKNMNIDIIGNLIDEDCKNLLSQRRYKIDNLFKTINNKNNFSSSERNEIKLETINKKSNIDFIEDNNKVKINQIQVNNKIIKKSQIIQNNQAKDFNRVINQINYFHILKSYFCFKDGKTETLNMCLNIINEDISIETIIKRFYNLEKGYNYLTKEEKELKIKKKKRIKDIK